MKRISVGLAAVVTSAVMVGCDGLGVMGIGRAPSLTGDWLVPVNNSVANMTLIEDGDNITGSYGASIFQFPLKGKRNQNAIEFTISANIMAPTTMKVTGEVSSDGKKITGTMKSDTVQQQDDGSFVTVPATESVAFTATKK